MKHISAPAPGILREVVDTMLHIQPLLPLAKKALGKKQKTTTDFSSFNPNIFKYMNERKDNLLIKDFL